MNFLRKEIDFWEKHTEEYESLSDKDYEELFTILPKENYKIILEIGCASGPFAKRFVKKYRDTIIYGIDISLNLLKNFKFHGVRADGAFLPFKSDIFDLVVFSASLHHIRRVGKVMNEVKRVLKGGGTLLMYEPNTFHPYRLLVTNNFLLDKFINPTSERALNPFKLKKILHNLSFINIKIDFITFQFGTSSLLGKINYKLSRFLQKIKLDLFFIHPWFIIVCNKDR